MHKLEIVRDIVIIAAGIAGILTGIVGSIFAIYRYRKSREAAAAIQIDLSIEIQALGGQNLVSVSVDLKNVSKVAVEISSDVCDEALLMVRKISAEHKNQQIYWDQLEKLIDDMPFLDTAWYGSDYPDEPFIIEPNCTDSFRVFFTSDYSGPVWIRAGVMDKDEYYWKADKIFSLTAPPP
jgi:hypothetical protein